MSNVLMAFSSVLFMVSTGCAISLLPKKDTSLKVSHMFLGPYKQDK